MIKRLQLMQKLNAKIPIKWPKHMTPRCTTVGKQSAKSISNLKEIYWNIHRATTRRSMNMCCPRLFCHAQSTWFSHSASQDMITHQLFGPTWSARLTQHRAAAELPLLFPRSHKFKFQNITSADRPKLE